MTERLPLFIGDIDLRFIERDLPEDRRQKVRVLQWRRAVPNQYSHGPNSAMWDDWKDVELHYSKVSDEFTIKIE